MDHHEGQKRIVLYAITVSVAPLIFCTLAILVVWGLFLRGGIKNLPKNQDNRSPVISKTILTSTLGVTPGMVESATPVPAAFPSAQVTETMETRIPPDEFYIVQNGDTLLSIAEQFYGATLDGIRRANQLPDDDLKTGQQIRIPFDGVYLVARGETLQHISAITGRSAQAIRAANHMTGDSVYPGQKLILSIEASLPASDYAYSTLQGDWNAIYPLRVERSDFTLHYQAATYPASATRPLAEMEESALDMLVQMFGTPLDRRFDVYVAGSLFENPDLHLRGRSFSQQYANFLLFDGTGSPDDQQYMAAHELTHLYAWHTFGVPVSTMLSEGLAVYVGTSLIAGRSQVPLEQFCVAMQRLGSLPSMDDSLAFRGHNLDLANYFASGCFVGYLIEAFGPDDFRRLYAAPDFESVYGYSLSEIDILWQNTYRDASWNQAFEPAELVAGMMAVANANEDFYGRFDGSPTAVEAYRQLDMARISLLEGRLAHLHDHLGLYQDIQ